MKFVVSCPTIEHLWSAGHYTRMHTHTHTHTHTRTHAHTHTHTHTVDQVVPVPRGPTIRRCLLEVPPQASLPTSLLYCSRLYSTRNHPLWYIIFIHTIHHTITSWLAYQSPSPVYISTLSLIITFTSIVCLLYVSTQTVYMHICLPHCFHTLLAVCTIAMLNAFAGGS